LIYESLRHPARRSSIELPAPMFSAASGMPGFSANGLRRYPAVTRIPALGGAVA